MKCPVKHIDLLTPTNIKDPYPLFSELRSQCPVVYSPELNMYLVSRHEDLDFIFSNPQTFSVANVSQPIHPMTEEASRALGSRFNPKPILANCDPPRHAIQRRAVRTALSPGFLKNLGEKIRKQAGQMIDDLVKKTEFDLVSELASPLTASIGLDAAGYSLDDMDSFLKWNANRVEYIWGNMPVENQKKVAENVRSHWEYAEDRVKFLWDNLDDSIISHMIRAHKENPEEFTFEEIVSSAFALVTASHETTTNAITNGISNLMRNREQWQMLCDDPAALAPGAAEEALRFEGSVSTWRRRTTRDVVISGVSIPEGADLLLLIGAANRDPDKFAASEVFDITRKNAKEHLTFGKGIHMCSGMQLARTQIQTVFELLAKKAPSLEMVTSQNVEYSPNISLRGPIKMMMRIAT